MEKTIIQKSENWDHNTQSRTRVLHGHCCDTPLLYAVTVYETRFVLNRYM